MKALVVIIMMVLLFSPAHATSKKLYTPEGYICSETTDDIFGVILMFGIGDDLSKNYNAITNHLLAREKNGFKFSMAAANAAVMEATRRYPIYKSDGNTIRHAAEIRDHALRVCLERIGNQ